MQKPKIMIAQTPCAVELTTEALGDYDLLVVSNVKAAHYHIQENGIDLFLIGVHFDDSRAIDLVKYIRADKEHKHTPIILVRLLSTSIGSSLRTITTSLKKIGTISEYLELENDPDAHAKLRSAVEALLPVQKFS